MEKRIIAAKFASKCSETGSRIRKGDRMLYDYSSKRCFCENSEAFQAFQEEEDRRYEAGQTAAYVQVQENAWCDNRYHG